MRFNAEIYNKVYHTPEANGAPEAGGGVVDPQPKPDAKPDEQTDEQKQSNDINVNINVTTDSKEGVADPALEAGGEAGSSDETPAESED